MPLVFFDTALYTLCMGDGSIEQLPQESSFKSDKAPDVVMKPIETPNKNLNVFVRKDETYEQELQDIAKLPDTKKKESQGKDYQEKSIAVAQEGIGEIVTHVYGDHTEYYHNGEKVFDSQEKDPAYASLDEFLLSPSGLNPEEYLLSGPVPKLTFKGTINSNLKDANGEYLPVPRWMRELQTWARDELKIPDETISNPDRGEQLQEQRNRTEDEEFKQFAQEAYALKANIAVFNYEPKGGGLGLAELRMQMIEAMKNGTKLIVRVQKPDTSEPMNEAKRDAIRDRYIAEADVQFFQEKCGNALDISFLGEESSFDDLKQSIRDALNSPKKEVPPDHFPLVSQENKEELVVMSGSSHNAKDMAKRIEIDTQIKQKGGKEVDTYLYPYSGDTTPVRDDVMKHRTEELKEMFAATKNIVYSGDASASRYGQLTTAILMSACNGSSIDALISNDGETDVRDEYDSRTIRMQLTQVLADVPELREKITVTDRIQPLVAAV